MSNPWSQIMDESFEANKANREMTLNRRVLREILGVAGAKNLLLQMKGELHEAGAEDTSPTLEYFLQRHHNFPAAIVTVKLYNLTDHEFVTLLRTPQKSRIHKAYMGVVDESAAANPIMVFDWVGVCPLVAVHMEPYLKDDQTTFSVIYSAAHGRGSKAKTHVVEPFMAWLKRLNWAV